MIQNVQSMQKTEQNTQPATLSEIDTYINQIFNNCSNEHNYLYQYSITVFKIYVKNQYAYWSDRNEANLFSQELFLSVSFQKLKSNTLVYLIIMNTLTELELGNKALKASRIAKDIPLIKPSKNPYVWKLLDKLLVWLSSPLGVSLHLTLQPLRDLIWKWFFIQKEEEQLSSLFLMDIFIRRFPSSLNSNFQSTQSLLFRALHEDNTEIQNAASHVLESIIDLFQTPYVNHAISIFNEVMKSFLDLSIPLKEGYVTAISRVFVKHPEQCEILKFTEPLLGRLSYSLSDDSLAGFAILPLAYRCSPKVFSHKHISAILEIYCSLFDRSTMKRERLLHFFGDLIFQFDTSVRIANQRNIDRIVTLLSTQIDCKEAAYAFLATASPRSETFPKVRAQIFSYLSTKLIANALQLFCMRWPKEAKSIKEQIIQTYNLTLLIGKEDQKMQEALRTMKMFEFKRSDIEAELIIQYSKNLNHENPKIRKTCVDFLLAQQREFPEIKPRLLAYVTVETSPEIRVYTLSRIKPDENDFVLIHPLYALQHDEMEEIRYQSFRLLTQIKGSSELITAYISEMVHVLTNSLKLDKNSINNLMIAAQCRPELLDPFRTFLTDLILKSSHQTSASLKLLSKLVEETPLDNLLPQIVQHLSNSLTLHSTNNRISAALDLLIVTLKNSHLKEEISTKYSNVLLKVIALSDGIEDKITRNKLVQALTIIGVIRKQDMHLLSTENAPKHLVTAVSIPVSSTDKMSILNALSVNTSLGIILGVLEDPALSAIFPKAVDALLAILKNNRQLNPEFEEAVAHCLKELICSDDQATVSIVLHNISVFITVIGDKFAPITQPLVDLICNSWGKLDYGLVLGAVRWMAFRIPTILEPHFVRITNVILPSIPLLTPKLADDVFSLFIATGQLLHEVDYLIVPAILNRLEVNYKDTYYADQIIEKLRPLFIEVGTEKYASEVMRVLIIVCKNNKSLHAHAIELFILIAAKQKEVFMIYLPELLPIVDLRSNSSMEIILQCLSSGVDLPQYISDEFSPKEVSDKTSSGKKSSGHFDRIFNRDTHFRMPKETWDAAEWSHWSDEFIPTYLVNSSLRSISACVGLSEHNANIRSVLFPISLAASVVSQNEELTTMIKHVLSSKETPDSIKKMILVSIDILDITGYDIGIPATILASQARSVGQNAQSLRYTEASFISNQVENVENLIFLQQTLGLKDSANAILKNFRITEIHDSCAIHLGFWDDALASYDKRIAAGETQQELIEGRMQCLMGLNRFNDLEKAAETTNNNFYRAVGSFYTFNDENLKNAVKLLGEPNEDNILYHIFYSILQKDYSQANSLVEVAMSQKSPKVVSSIATDYDRAYGPFSECCILKQIKESISILKNSSQASQRQIDSWLFTFNQLSDSPLQMLKMLRTYSLVLSKKQMIPFWMSFLHHTASMKDEQLREIAIKQLDNEYGPEYEFIMAEVTRFNKSHAESNELLQSLINKLPKDSTLLPEWERKRGMWLLEDGDFKNAIEPLRNATKNFKNHASTWLAYSKACFQLFEENPADSNALSASIEADLSALELSPVQSAQYIQHIASLIFQRGSPKIYEEFRKYFPQIPAYVWLNLLPQIIARLGGDNGLKDLMEELVTIIGKEYPSAAVYALIVQYRSNDTERQKQSAQLIDSVRKNYPVLVDGILSLTSELIRVSLSWFEKWSFVIDDAAKYYDNPKKCAEILLSTHEMIDSPPETMLEISFLSQFGSALQHAKLMLHKYIEDNDENAYNVAWQTYGTVLKKTRKIVSRLSVIPLEEASPILAKMNNSDIIVPGSYTYNVPHIKIFKFDKTLHILESKQRPRKLSVFGDDGRTYTFLLKANEDTRLDERVMQLFNFINSSIEHSPNIPHNLSIQTYNVVPLTRKVGLIGWVPGCHTISSIIAMYRDARGISTLAEMEAIKKENPNFEKASDEEKLRLYKIGISATPGVEIRHALLALASDSQHWLERRNMFTASLASTSMSGYLLGLGDRHPSNIMISDLSAKLVHIDFGDCFEVTMNRKSFPEIVPFRLTRSLTNALGVTGIEGEFRVCCETMMSLFRENAAQIMALLEAFIYDPLLQWTSSSDQEHPEIGIMKRIKDKIKGLDFSSPALSIDKQVNMLIDQATDDKNLSKMFRGWYPWL